MITSLASWRSAVGDSLPVNAIPARPDFGLRYPWRAVALHACSRLFARRLSAAVAIARKASTVDVSWWGMVSGKDSRAAVLVAAEAGWCPPLASVGDDCAAPGEEEGLEDFAARLGHPLTWIRPTTSTLLALRDADLFGDLHSQRSPVAVRAFYDPLEAFRLARGVGGVLWGLRAAESRGRAARRNVSGPLYRCALGWRCSPVADWTALDVHAMLARCDAPIPPWYLCVDPGQDPMSIRTDWWFSGPSCTTWAWLRRWWPDLWRVAAELDPRVGQAS